MRLRTFDDGGTALVSARTADIKDQRPRVPSRTGRIIPNFGLLAVKRCPSPDHVKLSENRFARQVQADTPRNLPCECNEIRSCRRNRHRMASHRTVSRREAEYRLSAFLSHRNQAAIVFDCRKTFWIVVRQCTDRMLPKHTLAIDQRHPMHPLVVSLHGTIKTNARLLAQVANWPHFTVWQSEIGILGRFWRRRPIRTNAPP